MGNKINRVKLNDAHLEYISKTTDLEKTEIKALIIRYFGKTYDRELLEPVFVAFYCELVRNINANELAAVIFKKFDKDANSKINLGEFLIGHSLITNSDARDKLNFAFDVYDIDNNGRLNTSELAKVCAAVLKFHDRGFDSERSDLSIVDEWIRKLDADNNCEVSRDEFIDCLMDNYGMRAFMTNFT
jgi:Ca2+-binding EF-hand superfamily protein